MRKKAKGTKAERDLLDTLWTYGVAAVRVAGSGSTSHPSSDIIASYKGKLAIIEVKTTSKEVVYVPQDEVSSMMKLALIMGGNCWLAIKFSSDRGKFYLVRINDARRLKSGSVAVDLDLARSKGFSVKNFAEGLIMA